MEETVISYNPADLKREIADLTILIDKAIILENKDVEEKVKKLKEVLHEEGLFKDKNIKLLIFTEHRDTLDYLAGDGQNGRPVGKLVQWGFEVTTIEGGMKI